MQSQVRQILLQKRPPLGSGLQQEMHPRPALGVIGLRHAEGLVVHFQSRQVGFPLAPLNSSRQQFQMHSIQAPSTSGDLEILGQALVQPERDVWQHRVQVSVSHFVPKVFRYPVSPLGIHLKPRVGFQEVRAARGEVRVVKTNEPVELLVIVEQVDVNRLIGDRQCQPVADVTSPGHQLLQQPVIGRQREIAVHDQLVADNRIADRQRQPCPRLHAPRSRQVGRECQQQDRYWMLHVRRGIWEDRRPEVSRASLPGSCCDPWGISR